MSFLQNFHLSPGQTIKPSRGFKFNSKQQNDSPNGKRGEQELEKAGYQNDMGYGTPTKANYNTNNNNNNNINSYGNFQPPITPRNFQQPSQYNNQNNYQQQHNNSAQIVDFNYTPTHQLPFISKNSTTQVSSHKDLKKIVATTLNSEAVLEQAVKLPKGEDLNEWFAVHNVDFYNHINMLYGTITEFCSPQSCPKMIATNEYEYLWNLYPGQPPVSVSAPKYVSCLMSWCQHYFDDETVFPTKENVPFPPNFVNKYVRPMLKRLFRVYAHIYCHHFNEIFEMNVHPLLNTSFRHFCLFTKHFQLLSDDDYGPLLELVNDLTSK
ncbi:hypothetical protein ACO0QE_001189 [Hanseniaspora vineae]